MLKITFIKDPFDEVKTVSFNSAEEFLKSIKTSTCEVKEYDQIFKVVYENAELPVFAGKSILDLENFLSKISTFEVKAA